MTAAAVRPVADPRPVRGSVGRRALQVVLFLGGLLALGLVFGAEAHAAQAPVPSLPAAGAAVVNGAGAQDRAAEVAAEPVGVPDAEPATGVPDASAPVPAHVPAAESSGAPAAEAHAGPRGASASATSPSRASTASNASASAVPVSATSATTSVATDSGTTVAGARSVVRTTRDTVRYLARPVGELVEGVGTAVDSAAGVLPEVWALPARLLLPLTVVEPPAEGRPGHGSTGGGAARAVAPAPRPVCGYTSEADQGRQFAALPNGTSASGTDSRVPAPRYGPAPERAPSIPVVASYTPPSPRPTLHAAANSTRFRSRPVPPAGSYAVPVFRRPSPRCATGPATSSNSPARAGRSPASTCRAGAEQVCPPSGRLRTAETYSKDLTHMHQNIRRSIAVAATATGMWALGTAVASADELPVSVPLSTPDNAADAVDGVAELTDTVRTETAAAKAAAGAVVAQATSGPGAKAAGQVDRVTGGLEHQAAGVAGKLTGAVDRADGVDVRDAQAVRDLSGLSGTTALQDLQGLPGYDVPAAPDAPIDYLFGPIEQIPGHVRSTADGAGTTAQGTVQDAAQGALTEAGPVVGQTSDAVLPPIASEAVSAVLPVVDQALGDVGTLAQGVVSEVAPFADGVVEQAALPFVHGVTAEVQPLTYGAVGAVQPFAGGVVSEVQPFAGSVVSEVQPFAGAVVSDVQPFAGVSSPGRSRWPKD